MWHSIARLKLHGVKEFMKVGHKQCLTILVLIKLYSLSFKGTLAQELATGHVYKTHFIGHAGGPNAYLFRVVLYAWGFHTTTNWKVSTPD